MMDIINKLKGSSDTYHEESIKVPVIITVVVLLLTSLPLTSWILNINREGTLAADVTNYQELIRRAADDVRVVDILMRNDNEALALIRQSSQILDVDVIAPSVTITAKPKQKDRMAVQLNVKLEGIYWSAANPLVGINGETYGVGDVIQDHTIIEIGKTAVMFEGGDGIIIEKNIYEDLP